MGCTKRNKRCIPKEGMPHARNTCQKKERKDAYPKKVCHTPTRCVKKMRKRKYSPYQKYYKGERNHIKEFHPPCNEHGTIYAISSDFGDRMTMQSMGLMVLLSEHF